MEKEESTTKAIIVGATSGIGKELAEVLLREGYVVGLAGRRISLLEELKAKYSGRVFLKLIDVSQAADAMDALDSLILEMAGVDVVVISSGVGFINKKLEWMREKETIDVNVSGFAAMSNVAMRYFLSRGSGHLVGISSIVAIRGGSAAPAYNASKAFVSNYLDGMRKKAAREGKLITVTDIQPGYVDTAMAKGNKFWVASPREAAEEIYDAIKRKRKHAYVTRRWRLIAWLLKIMPDYFHNRI
ncbi:MAG TPA: SDR family NAD(P)-dependent oxidoreductase [Thermodesulfovibrionales bacterium]|nr:SDR family NAD(P)-dependent oxidoreductase [Thermodesulfovibrionales bacterium]